MKPRPTLKAMLLAVLKALVLMAAGVAAATVFNVIVLTAPWLINPPPPCPAGARCFPAPGEMVQLLALTSVSIGAVIALFYAPSWKILRRAGRDGPLAAALLGAGWTLVFCALLFGWPGDQGAALSVAQYVLSGAVGGLAAWLAGRRLGWMVRTP